MNKKQSKQIARALNTLHRLGVDGLSVRFGHPPYGSLATINLGTLQDGVSRSKLDAQVRVQLIPEPPEPQTCSWYTDPDDDTVQITSCGVTWCFNDDDPKKDEKLRYCAHCGRPVCYEVDPVETDDE
jgi:hypothetical protein